MLLQHRLCGRFLAASAICGTAGGEGDVAGASKERIRGLRCEEPQLQFLIMAEFQHVMIPIIESRGF